MTFDPNLSHSGLDRLGNIEQYLVSIQSQLLNANLTAIGALNPSTANVIASDGSGWIAKTYAQLKTALTLVAADVGLGNVTNDAQLKASQLDTDGTMAANSDSRVASQKATRTYIAGKSVLTPTAVKTTGYTAAVGDLVPVDTTSGSVTVTLPTAPADKSVVCVKHVIQGTTAGVPNTVTLNAAGSDVFNVSGGVTTKSLPLLSQAITVQYNASTAIWYVVNDDLPLTQLDNRYPSVYNVKSYGAVGDNSTDDTTAIQNAVNAAVAASGTCYFPGGAYKITSAITIPAGAQWKIEGESRGGTEIWQYTDNTPIFKFTAASSCYGFSIRSLTFYWANQQLTTLSIASTNVSTTLTVASTTPFGAVAATGTLLVVDMSNLSAPAGGEQMTYTVASATTLTVSRGANGSSATAHGVGSTVIPVGATQACALYFNGSSSAQFYNWVAQDCRFENGSYFIGMAGGVTQAVWGITVRDLDAHNIVGGVWYAPQPFTGSPNNKFENVYVFAQYATGPIFDLYGIASTWLTGIEINQSYLGATVIMAAGGGNIAIGTLKTELGLYDGLWCSGGKMLGCLFSIPGYSFTAQFLKLQGITCNTSGMARPYVFDVFGGTLGRMPVEIDLLDMTGDSGWTLNPASSYYVGNATATTGGILINNIFPGAVPLINAGQPLQDLVCVQAWNNGTLSSDIGDANLSWTLGTSQNIISYETTLTAGRTVTLPDQTTSGGSNLFNGLTITVARTAAGAFNLTVQRGSTTLDTIAAPTNAGSTSTVTYVYRRGKWVRTVRAIN